MKTAEARAIMAVLANLQANDIFRLLPSENAKAGSTTAELARELTLPASTVSRHLTGLTKIGLAKRTRVGRVVQYRRDPGPLRRLLSHLADLSG